VTVEAINQAFDTPYQKSESEPQLDGQNKNGNFESGKLLPPEA
jgi:hypothetical protein